MPRHHRCHQGSAGTTRLPLEHHLQIWRPIPTRINILLQPDLLRIRTTTMHNVVDSMVLLRLLPTRHRCSTIKWDSSIPSNTRTVPENERYDPSHDVDCRRC